VWPLGARSGPDRQARLDETNRQRPVDATALVPSTSNLAAERLDREIMMAKKTARGRKQDRARVAGKQDYEVRYEAKKTGKSTTKVKRAAKKAGPSRKKVERALRE
jgi:uncharacterized protein DUF3606